MKRRCHTAPLSRSLGQMSNTTADKSDDGGDSEFEETELLFMAAMMEDAEEQGQADGREMVNGEEGAEMADGEQNQP